MSDPFPVEDRLAIAEVLSAYALRLDQYRLDEWLDVFLPDAVMHVPGMDTLHTHQDRLAMAASAPVGTHVCAPPLIRAGSSPDEAEVEQAYIFKASGTRLIMTGWYEDKLVKDDGRWRIAFRRIHFARRAEPPPGD